MSTVNVKDSTRGSPMKARDRQPAANQAPTAVLAGPSNGVPNFLWEDWYRSASPSQQAELLALAGRQGLLYVQQIPANTNGREPSPTIAAEKPAGQSVLAEVLAGHAKLNPVEPPPVPEADANLDPLQKQAVARALGTPDLCLIQGLPGTGKSRVVAEILTQAARQGRRVLFLAQHPAAVDKVLETLAGREGLFPIRLTCPTEAVPAQLQPMLLAQRMTGFRSEALRKARLAHDKVEEQCRGRHREEACWPEFAALVEQQRNLLSAQQALAEKIAQTSADVERDISAGNLNGSFASLTQARAHDLAEWQKAHNDQEEKTHVLQQNQADYAVELQGIEPIFAAKTEGKWWTFAWWQATVHSQFLARKTELDRLRLSVSDALRDLEKDKAGLEQQRRDIDCQFQAKRASLMQEETARRLHLLREEEARLLAEARQAAERWQTLLAGLEPAELRPRDLSCQAVEAAHLLWQSQKQKDDKNCQFARQWVAFLEDAGERLSARLPALAGIVAGTAAAWQHEAAFFPGPFDLLVLEEAEQFTEANLLPLARKAQRWVLVANYQTPIVNSIAPANPRQLRAVVPPRPSAFQRLWQSLHTDASQLPYTWSTDANRLLCQLRPVAPQDRSRLESERLADAPDIELRILNQPRKEPLLAQVVFPPETPLAQAKGFIYRELQEFALQTFGHNGWLEEQADLFAWHLVPPLPAAEECEPIQLEAGLCECTAQGQSTRLEFAADRWSKDQVLAWVQRHLHQRDLGRTMFLQVPHRMRPNLAHWVEDVFFPELVCQSLLPCEHFACAGSLLGNGAPVVFVPAPGARGDDLGKNDQNKLPRESAGLEIDLTTGRFSDRIPSELVAGLPRQGYANYLEAQAVVRTLETLCKQSEHIALSVQAFYPGQVELLRQLLARSACLVGRDIEIGLPGQFRQRECQVSVVSLTRSNFHRSGTFATDAADPLLALSRAQQQLILVGDPSTLIRWSQSQDPTESSDGREKSWMRQLSRYLQGKGSFQAAFYLCESS